MLILSEFDKILRYKYDLCCKDLCLVAFFFSYLSCTCPNSTIVHVIESVWILKTSDSCFVMQMFQNVWVKNTWTVVFIRLKPDLLETNEPCCVIYSKSVSYAALFVGLKGVGCRLRVKECILSLWGSFCVGLTCHQSRPFTMASCSRDSTVRLWSLTPLISPLLLNILTNQPWEKVIGNTGESEALVCYCCSSCFTLTYDWGLCLLRHGDGSWVAAAALWESVQRHQAGAGQTECRHQGQEAALVLWMLFGNVKT